LFVGAGLAWSVVDLIRFWLASSSCWNDEHEKPGKMVGLWIVLDLLLLLVITYGINSWISDELARAVVVALLYLLFLLFDLLAIVRGIQFG